MTKVQSMKKTAIILMVIILLAIIFWPLPAQFRYVGSQFVTFALALYMGLRLWRNSDRGRWLKEFQRNNKFSWIVYVAILFISGALAWLSMNILGYWPRAVIEFILVIGIIYFALRDIKRFLI